MSAADSMKAFARKELLRAMTPHAALGLVAVVLLVGAYCAGKHAATVTASLAANVAKRDTVRVQTAVHDTVFRHDTVRVRVTQAAASAARDTASKALQIAQQAIQRADSARSDSLPTAAVLPAVEACPTALRADSVSYAALHVALLDMTQLKDDWKRADSLDVAKLTLVKAPRFGFKTGAVLGAAAVALLVHLVK